MYIRDSVHMQNKTKSGSWSTDMRSGDFRANIAIYFTKQRIRDNIHAVMSLQAGV